MFKSSSANRISPLHLIHVPCQQANLIQVDRCGLCGIAAFKVDLTSISRACSRYLPPRPIFHEFRGSPTDLQRSPCRSACPNPCPGNTGMHFLETHIHKASRALQAPWNQAPDIIVQNDLSQAVAKHVKLPYPWKSGSEVGSFVRKI